MHVLKWCKRFLCVKNISRHFVWKELKQYSDLSSSKTICVIGSGPAGFGLTQYLLKNHDTLNVHMFEKLPVPYGLVRYGVSPDHQDVKNCIHGYERLAENPRFSFFGNVEVGNHVSLYKLLEHYTAVALCSGAQVERRVTVPGYNLGNVYSCNEFVGWYNGLPSMRHIDPDLSGSTALIVGVGNVALDCARMLLKPSRDLKETDITSYAYDKLLQSNIKKVVIVGRRGPLQMACTRKELAEITDLEKVRTIIEQSDFTEDVKNALKVKNLKLRKTQRLVKHLMSVGQTGHTDTKSSEFVVKLLRSPLELVGSNDRVSGIILKKNSMTGVDAFNPTIDETDEIEHAPCSLVISCIGYDNKPLDEVIPFSAGKILNSRGRIEGHSSLYACGWCKTGPKGVLADTLNDCIITGSTIVEDLGSLPEKTPDVKSLLPSNHDPLSWKNWRVIDEYESNTGISLGKVREKLTNVDKMCEVAFK